MLTAAFYPGVTMIKKKVLGKGKVQLYTGNSYSVLRKLPDKSVHCCVTSPPYFNLRDYGTGQWFGGDPDCMHRSGDQTADNKNKSVFRPGVRPGSNTSFFTCMLCGAERKDFQIGVESSLSQYIGRLVKVFREVRRVLRDDGTLWVNMGDTYNAGRNENSQDDANLPGLKPKDLIGVPWELAFALRADGWYLRADIIWSKYNNLPSSVRDRPSIAHEYIFMLSKSQRYFYDLEAVRVPSRMKISADLDTKVNLRSVWDVPTKPYKEAHFAVFPDTLIEPCIKAGASHKGCCDQCGSPMVRQIEVTSIPRNELPRDHPDYRPNIYPRKSDKSVRKHLETEPSEGQRYSSIKTIGWERSCDCEDFKSVPCVVLDPFNGSGTTGLVALRNGCHYIGIDLNPEYVAMTENRLSSIARANTLF